MLNIGADAKPAVPALLRIAATDRGVGVIVPVSLKASDALARTGASAVPSLINALGHSDVRYRRAAAAALNSMTELSPAAAREAIAPLLEALEDSEACVRAHAAIATWNATRDAARTVPVLDSLVREVGASGLDGKLDVRKLAIQALGHVGPDAERIIPTLIDVIRDKSAPYYHQDDAVEALGRIGPAAKVGYGQLFVTDVRRSRARPWGDGGVRTRTTDIHVRRSFVEQLPRANTFCVRTRRDHAEVTAAGQHTGSGKCPDGHGCPSYSRTRPRCIRAIRGIWPFQKDL